MSGELTNEGNTTPSGEGSEVLRTVTRTWALNDGVETHIESVDRTIVFGERPATELGELAENEDGLVYSGEGDTPPTPTAAHFRQTVESEFAGESVSIFSLNDFRVLDKTDMRAICNGEMPAAEDFIVLSSLEPLQGYVCRASAVTLVTIASDGLGRELVTSCERDAADLAAFEGRRVTLEHQDGSYVATVAEQEGETEDTIGVRVLSLLSNEDKPPTIRLGSAYDGTTLRSEDVADVAGALGEEQERQEEWVTVTLEKQDNIYARSVSDDREWIFETQNGVLDSEEDIAFFEAVGFTRLDEADVTLRAIPVTGEPDAATWKLNQTGNWWLCPVTLE